MVGKNYYNEITTASQDPVDSKYWQCFLLKVVFEAFAAHRVAEFAQRFCFYLPDPLPSDAKNLAHFFEGA